MRLSLWIGLVILLAASVLSLSSADNATMSCNGVQVSENEVIRSIFSDYSKQGRPRRNGFEAVNVTIAFRISGIHDFVERENLLIVNGYLTLGWRDDYLIWSHTWPYSCIQKVYAQSNQIWLPDVALVNSLGDVYSAVTMPRRVEISSNGNIYHSPMSQFQVFCHLDTRYFPFDDQTCRLSFRNWNIPSNLQNFILFGTHPIKQIDWLENSVWEVVNMSAQLFVEPPNWEEVVFTIVLSRRPLFYYVNYILPTLIISLVELSTFAIPLGDVLKLHISITCLLAYSVFETAIVGELPKSSEATPLLCIYINLQSILIGCAILGEALVFHIIDSKNSKHVPKALWVFFRFIGPLLGVRQDEQVEHGAAAKPKEKTVSEFVFELDMAAREETVSSRRRSSIWHLPRQSVAVSKDGSAKMATRRPTTLSIVNTPPVVEIYSPSHYQQQHEEHPPATWIYVAKVIGRLSFYVYLLGTVVSPFVMFAILPYTKSS